MMMMSVDQRCVFLIDSSIGKCQRGKGRKHQGIGFLFIVLHLFVLKSFTFFQIPFSYFDDPRTF